MLAHLANLPTSSTTDGGVSTIEYSHTVGAYTVGGPTAVVLSYLISPYPLVGVMPPNRRQTDGGIHHIGA